MSESLEEYGRRINNGMTRSLNVSTYKQLSNDSVDQTLNGPVSYYPVLTPADYTRGKFTRYFFVRYNGVVTEVDNKEASVKRGTLTHGLYHYVALPWRLVDSPTVPRAITGAEPTILNVNSHYVKHASTRLPDSLRAPFIKYFANLEAFKLST